jgi:hypothetical protein
MLTIVNNKNGADLTGADLTWGRFDLGPIWLGPIWFGADLTCFQSKNQKIYITVDNNILLKNNIIPNSVDVLQSFTWNDIFNMNIDRSWVYGIFFGAISFPEIHIHTSWFYFRKFHRFPLVKVIYLSLGNTFVY